MRIVLDTNVLVSGALNPHSAPGRCLDLVLDGELILLFDDRILAEYREVLLRPRFQFGRQDVDALLVFLRSEGESIVARPIAGTLPDPDDLPFLEVAVAGGADALVSGNLRHFPEESVPPSVEVLAPAALLERLAR